jgi:hypothetical protein
MKDQIIFKQHLTNCFHEYEETLQVPVGALHLDIQFQHGYLTVWYVCDPNEKRLKEVRFLIIGTGRDVSEDLTSRWHHIKTLQHEDYVWHIFCQ